MSYDDAFGIDVREVTEMEREGKPARMVSGSRVYATDIADLWDALTNKERIPRWFSPISGELKLDGHYQLEGNAGGKITQCSAPQAFDVTWEIAENTSCVNVRLEACEESTKLTLQHIMPQDRASEEFWQQYGPGATGVGWDCSFHGLALHLESGGSAIDKNEYEAWMASKAGKAFLRDCASAWGAAHIAAGESTKTAQAMADKTAGFYTGA